MDDPNRRHHIFGKSKHNLDRLVRQYGDVQAAEQAMREAIDAAFQRGDLIVNQHGRFRQVFDIGGVFVTVSGRVINGIVRVATAWIPL